MELEVDLDEPASLATDGHSTPWLVSLAMSSYSPLCINMSIPSLLLIPYLFIVAYSMLSVRIRSVEVCVMSFFEE